MIRARADNGMFILGIDAENVRRLRAGKPIFVSLAELGGTDEVVIMYGDTHADIERELEAATNRPLPKAQTPAPLSGQGAGPGLDRGLEELRKPK